MKVSVISDYPFTFYGNKKNLTFEVNKDQLDGLLIGYFIYVPEEYYNKIYFYDDKGNIHPREQIEKYFLGYDVPGKPNSSLKNRLQIEEVIIQFDSTDFLVGLLTAIKLFYPFLDLNDVKYSNNVNSF